MMTMTTTTTRVSFATLFAVRTLFHGRIVSDTELNNMQTANTTKSETNTDHDLDDTGNDDVRRSSRATTQKNYAKQEDDVSHDEDEDVEDLFVNGQPPPRRMRYKKRRGSDDSFVDDDDDYEKLQRKRKIVKYGKVVSRSSITDHLKNFVDDDPDSAEGKQSGMKTVSYVKIERKRVLSA